MVVYLLFASGRNAVSCPCTRRVACTKSERRGFAAALHSMHLSCTSLLEIPEARIFHCLFAELKLVVGRLYMCTRFAQSEVYQSGAHTIEALAILPAVIVRTYFLACTRHWMSLLSAVYTHFSGACSQQ